MIQKETRLPCIDNSGAKKVACIKVLGKKYGYPGAILVTSIKKVIPNFTIEYKPDFRQAIADSWPRSIDDGPARRDWKWSPKFDIDSMTADMFHHLRIKYGIPA